MNILQKKCFSKEWLDTQKAQMQRVDPGLLEKSISTPFAIPGKELNTRIPSVEGLTADKLTAFAPRTIGVRYAERSSLKIMKHCADIGVLYDHCSKINYIFDAYESIWPVENSYRENRFTREQVLNDTIDTSRLICQIGLKGCPDYEEVQLLSRGISQLNSHVIGSRFTRDEAKICAAKAAFIATALNKGAIGTELPHYNIEELKELVETPLTEANVQLNRLGKGNPEAYYYWLKAEHL